ncbi:hypothetical protein PY365_08340 [Roseiarcaceae bacterium H3SJ34-1]|uniref:hypothetical protein n=1 Tax=Terripilifer ovatus TaxID=3032367 RepID=UPI003AB99015|nr:hypothetical protein [Roseiarcaceae bacterium H3SJ34-1]
MISRILIAIGAGLAAALLFYIPVKGTALAMVLATFASLPIMIVGLAFSPLTALIAAIAGSLVLAIALNEILAATFAFSAALPAWWLTRLAWLARPVVTGEPAAAADGLVWYPLGHLLAWIAALAAAISIGGLLLALYRFGSFDAFLDEAVRRMSPMIDMIFDRGRGMPAGITSDELARIFIQAMAPVFAGWTVATTVLNLWLAGRIALISQRLGRPWFPVPESLHLPRTILYAFVVGFALMLTGGFFRVTGYTLVAAFGTALAFQGLASLHMASRPSRVRTTMLTVLYTTIFVLFPLPLPLLAAVGLIDMLTGIRTRSAKPGNSST